MGGCQLVAGINSKLLEQKEKNAKVYGDWGAICCWRGGFGVDFRCGICYNLFIRIKKGVGMEKIYYGKKENGAEFDEKTASKIDAGAEIFEAGADEKNEAEASDFCEFESAREIGDKEFGEIFGDNLAYENSAREDSCEENGDYENEVFGDEFGDLENASEEQKSKKKRRKKRKLPLDFAVVNYGAKRVKKIAKNTKKIEKNSLEQETKSLKNDEKTPQNEEKLQKNDKKVASWV